MHRRCLLVMIVAAVSHACPLASADVTVRFDPPDTMVNLGDVFTLNVVADIPEPVVAWGLDVTISDDLVLSAWPDNVLCAPPAIGMAWVDPGYTADGDLLAGVAFPNPVSGTSVLLATLTFAADNLGVADLLLSDDNPSPHVSPPNDLSEGFGLDPSGFADVTYEVGHVEVVPEPTTLWLLIPSGLALARRGRTR